jgi:hypothetical protein
LAGPETAFLALLMPPGAVGILVSRSLLRGGTATHRIEENAMRWDEGRQSTNIEDRRGASPVRKGVFGGGIGLVVLVIIGMIFGIDPRVMLGLGAVADKVIPQKEAAPGPAPGEGGRPDPDAQMKQFVAFVLGDTEETWNAIFKQSGKQYREPKLVLFSGAVQSACGHAQAAMGPFYCPADQKVYIDLAFYQDLQNRFKAPGDFAQAYVIAHEVGHHVQNLLGIADQVRQLQQRVGQREANELSVRMELQADCLAGVWANHAQKARKVLEQGDIEEGLNAAAQIGDDRMMKRSQGYVVPDAFTHGSGEQRVRWFKRGLQTGSVSQCDTFAATQL